MTSKSDSNNNDDWVERTKENISEINYLLRTNVIETKQKHQHNSRFRKYDFTEFGNTLKREYINKTLPTMYNRNYGRFDYVRIHSELLKSVSNRILMHINP